MTKARRVKKNTKEKKIRLNVCFILGDPGADSGDEGKSKRAEKYGTKKSKERRVLAPIRSQNGGDCWNWSSKTLSPGALLAVLYFSSCHIFPPV